MVCKPHCPPQLESPFEVEYDTGESDAGINRSMDGTAHVFIRQQEPATVSVSGPWDLLGMEYEPSFLYQFDKWWDWHVYGVMPLRPFCCGDKFPASRFLSHLDGILMCVSGQTTSDFWNGKAKFLHLEE